MADETSVCPHTHIFTGGIAVPIVSIIMPVYNKEKYLPEVLEAFISQSFENWEMIIINDGSTDQSASILAFYAAIDHRVSIIHQKNQGVSAARNRGLALACGEWIWFVDGDDVPDSDFLERVFRNRDDPCADLIIGHYEQLENHRLCRISITEEGIQSTAQLASLFMKYQYRTGYFGYLWNKLIRREIIQLNARYFDENLTLAEDLQFLVSLYRLGIRVLILPYTATCYRVNTENSASRGRVDYFAQLRIQLLIRNWIINDLHRRQYIPFFRKIISTYAACIIFHGYESHIDDAFLARKLYAMETVKKELDIRGIEPALVPIVWCLKTEQFHLMHSYLVFRSSIRRIYRKLKGR